MIGIIDYEAGNIASVANALASLDIEHIVSGERDKLRQCGGIILPGVGAAPGAMTSLQREKMTDFIRAARVPLLGICLGMQLLYERSEEGDTTCLGIVPGIVTTLNEKNLRVPNIGWSEVEFTGASFLTAGLRSKEYFYFAHSFAANVGAETMGVMECGGKRSALVQKKNYFGVQFHPEKSGKAGLQLLKNFATQCESFRQ